MASVLQTPMPLALPTLDCGADNYLLGLFVALVIQDRARYRVFRQEHWAVAAVELEPEERTGLVNSDGHTTAVLDVADGALQWLQLAHGTLHVYVAGAGEAEVRQALARIRTAYPVEGPREGPTVPITFWALGQHGPQSFRRKLEVPAWAAIRRNYPAATLGPLEALMRWREPAAGGQLVLWQGPPGTGKTWCLRALASEWRAWCRFEYVCDPDALFERAAYLTQVLLEDGSTEAALIEPPGSVVASAPWRCLVLEDTGELLATDAKAELGQALSRLLNVVDGLLGQGLRVLLLITTNEALTQLHPAVTRPGRCLYQVNFEPFAPEDAAHWLGEPTRRTATLAELYHRLQAFPLERKPRAGAGFIGP